MSRDLTDVLHAFVDDQARASAADGRDPAQRARTVAALVRRRRTQRVSGLAAASVALLAAGAVAASALTGPEPLPAVPEPSATASATASASPSPSATATPTPSPSATGIPDQPVSWSRGIVDPFTTTPRELWSVTLADIFPDGAAAGLTFGDVVLGHARADQRVIEAGEVVVALVSDADALDGFVVGLDATTGETRWSRSIEGDRPTHACAGTSPDGLVVCTGSEAPGGTAEVQLLDPASGDVVRAHRLDFHPDSSALAGSILVLHAGTGPESIDVRWAGVDVTTGEVVWSHEAPGRGVAFEVSDIPAVSTDVSGAYVRLDGYFYTLLVDARTGDELVRAVDPLANSIFPVWAPTRPEVAPVFTSWADEDGQLQPTSLRAVDPADGSVLWEQDTVSATPIALVGDVLMASDTSFTTQDLYAFDATTGQVLWTAEREFTTGVAATDGTHLLLTDGSVRLLEDGMLLAGPTTTDTGLVQAVGGSNRFSLLHRDRTPTLTLFGW